MVSIFYAKPFELFQTRLKTWVMFQAGPQVLNGEGDVSHSFPRQGAPVVALLQHRLAHRIQGSGDQVDHILVATGVEVSPVWPGLVPQHAPGPFLLRDRWVKGESFIVDGGSPGVT